ncbi:hypothetical protein Csa_004209 [Cucumis sativus]|uniref:Uncharacterized protein n=1 Tax=Cucumis sativus TaxID=3659 RepID=A0A0A0KE40_CUCSA|nr:hypothetical protein Csa_004209 [Cucumis sativus]
MSERLIRTSHHKIHIGTNHPQLVSRSPPFLQTMITRVPPSSPANPLYYHALPQKESPISEEH